MKTITTITLIFLLFSCNSKQKEKTETPKQKTNSFEYALPNPPATLGLDTDTATIFWAEKTFLGTPSLFKRNKVMQMTLKDCAEGYCHGTTIYFNEDGFPIKEVSLNANSLYFNYEQKQPGVITDKKLSQDTNSIDYDYNYTKVIEYPETSFFYTETITFSDKSQPQVTYAHINDSIKLAQEKQSSKIDTLMHSFTNYTGLVKNEPEWKIKLFNDNEFEVLMPGDIKVPGGDEFGGPLRIKYKRDDNKLITSIQYVNKFDVILKELEVEYKRRN